MIYLSQFTFPPYDAEYAFRLDRVKRTCYNTMYPFFVLSSHGLERLDFAPVTVFLRRERLRQDDGAQCDCRAPERQARRALQQIKFFRRLCEHVYTCSIEAAAPGERHDRQRRRV